MSLKTTLSMRSCCLLTTASLALLSATSRADDEPRLYIEPITGLTTVRHPAPAATSIPLGVEIQLCHSFPKAKPSPSIRLDETLPQATAVWSGADADRMEMTMAWATHTFEKVGPHDVSVRIVDANGGEWESACRFHVVDVAAEDVSIGQVTPFVSPFLLDEDATNEETMAYYFGESIASLQRAFPTERRTDKRSLRNDVAGSANAARFVTSVDRSIDFQFSTFPEGFEPLMEVRRSQGEPYLARSGARAFSNHGLHNVEVGPPSRAKRIDIQTYKVVILSHQSDHDIIPEGTPVTFEAVTIPPGYEDHITWLSSTKYGTGFPVLGRGPTFTTRFENPWARQPNDSLFLWLGVRADHATYNLDMFLRGGCAPPGIGRIWCIDFGPGGNAQNNGKNFFEWKATRAAGGQQSFDMDFDVDANDTPLDKAMQLETSLTTNFGAHVNVCRNGTTVCMRLKPDNPLGLTEIDDGKLKDSKTGEGNIDVFDPPSILRTAVIDVEEVPSSPTGVVEFAVEGGPIISINTFGKSASQIESELVSAFNVAYAELDHEAIHTGTRVEVPFVRCDMGVKGGTTDIGLDVEVGFEKPLPLP